MAELVDQRECVLLGQARFAGGVEYTDQLAFVIEDRRRSAGEAGVPGQLVLVLVHGNGALFEQAGAHAVGSLRTFAPYRTAHQAGLRCNMREGGVAGTIEQHSLAVGQHDCVSGSCRLLVQVGHLDFGDCLDIGEAPHPELGDAVSASRTSRSASALNVPGKAPAMACYRMDRY